MFGQASINQFCHHKNFDVVNGDVRIEKTMKPLIANADVIIPLAALVGAPYDKDPVAAKSTNNDAVLLMLKLLSTDQRVLMPTTNSAYGSGDDGNFVMRRHLLNQSLRTPSKRFELSKSLRVEKILFRSALATVFGMSPR